MPIYALFSLLFLCLNATIWSLSQTELYESFKNKKYTQIHNDFQNNPTIYNTAVRLNILGQAQLAIGLHEDAIRSCAKVLMIEPLTQCAIILRQLRKQKKDTYEAVLAKLYLDNGDYDSAFSKYYRLYLDHPKNEIYRIGLIRTFLGKGQLDTVRELLWSLKKETKERDNFENILSFSLGKLIKSSEGVSADEIIRNPDNYYQILLLSQKKIEPYFSVLYKHWNELYLQADLDLSELEIMRLANLNFLNSKIDVVWEIIDDSKDMLVKPRAIISMDSLVARLPARELDNQDQESQSEGLQQIDYEAVVSTTQTQGRDKRFVPLDLSALDMSTPNDLEAFEKLSEDYTDRMKLMKTDAQRRWLYTQVSDKLTEMWSHHVDPSKHAIAAYFETPRGKDFLSEMEEKHAEYERIDKKNSKMFDGRLLQVETGLSGARNRADKIQVLRKFKLEWDMYKNTSNLSMKGAWSAYLKSEEGTNLLKRMEREIGTLELMKGKKLSTGVYRKYQ